MIFRTEIQVTPPALHFSTSTKVVTIGSCFADVIGNKLQQNKVETLINPFGTIFNPQSACLLLEVAAGKPYNFEQHLVEHHGIWYAYDLHSSLSSPSKDELLQTIGQRVEQTRIALQQANLLIMTWGTAVGYQLNSTGSVVANCHKLPSKNFTRFLLTGETIVSSFDSMHAALKKLNPALTILQTVSPVRHIKEMLEINSVSKSILRVACHQLQEKHQDVLYFPAYEIMLDDLRDYRFYKKDMIHPTETAEEYIWAKFTNAFFAKDFQLFLEEWQKIKQALAHKPFHPASEAHQIFLKSSIRQLERLAEKYSIDINLEKQQLEAQLI